MLERKIDGFLAKWKTSARRLPLVVRGARQVGKTRSIEAFAHAHYKNVVEVNFALQKQYKGIFDDGFEVDRIVKNMSFIDPSLAFNPGDTLIFFDEIQDCVNCASSLKSFKLDGRYDVVCSGSMMGINYNEIESNSVGYKQDYIMRSLDFEEFCWAKGYSKSQLEDLFSHMAELAPFSKSEYAAMLENFREYMVVGGMPAIVDAFVESGNYSGILEMQRQIDLDYEEDITKYAGGLDKGKILHVYRSIPVFLGKENKKFQISKVARGARNREYVGTVEWLCNAGIVNVCHCMAQPELPIRGNYDPKSFKLYFGDPGMLVASLDDEAQLDLRENKNFNTYKGAVYENVVADALVKQGYDLHFYRNEKSTVEVDFVVRDATGLVPVEVKADDGTPRSLVKMVEGESYADVGYGIKFCNRNVGFNGKFYTFPYFLAMFTRRFLEGRRAPAPAAPGLGACG